MTALPNPINADGGTAQFPLYNATTDTSPAKFISLAELASMAFLPSIGPKKQAQALTPYLADAKTKDAAVASEYHAAVIDHDNDDRTSEQIAAIYDPYDCAYLAFTSSSHQQEKAGVIANRWKVVIPFERPISFERWYKLANGLALKFGSDKAQARAQQPFYVPNKVSQSAAYDHIDRTDMALLDATDDSQPLVAAALDAFEQDQQRRQREAQQAQPKPRPGVANAHAGIIERICEHYSLTELLASHSYTRTPRAWLSPDSTSGNPGVVILQGDDGKERLYSHHGESDPLSNLNHDGHALDAADVLCTLEYGGDFSRMIHKEADKLDPEGQRQRRREHGQQRTHAEAVKGAADLLNDDDQDEQPAAPEVDLENPPGLAGQICKYMADTARRPRPELYPVAALHLMALVGRQRSSIYTRKPNLMTLAIAPTAAGKEHPQDVLKRLAKQQWCSHLVHNTPGSHKDIIMNVLEGDGASLYSVDEVHSLFASIRSVNAQNYEQKMEAELLSMFATEIYTFRGIEKRGLVDTYQSQIDRLEKQLGKAQEDGDADKQAHLAKALEKARRRFDWLENGLPDPFLSLMGHSVPERLDGFVTPANIDSGLLGRMLIVRCPETRAPLRRPNGSADQDPFTEFNIEQGLQRIWDSRNRIIDADPDAAAYLDQCVDWYDDDEQRNHHIVGGVYARAPEHLYRVATLLAMDCESITIEHARYADALVRQSIEDVRHLLLKAYAASEGAQEQAIMQHAMQVVHRNCKGTGETLSRIRHLVTKPKNWQDMERKNLGRDLVQELLDRMVDEGLLELSEKGRRRRYISRSGVCR